MPVEKIPSGIFPLSRLASGIRCGRIRRHHPGGAAVFYPLAGEVEGQLNCRDRQIMRIVIPA
ncbi:hypothetical protein GCM10025772_10980 [Ferrimonas gelatinilytica]|uniref:Uncharacterized protein n=1 Tax=Ferrimonas gelatinilytica TaxID=1255257 RepID=A0ABP9RYM6_9GAMM